MLRIIRFLSLSVAGLAFVLGSSHASTHDFYKGKTMRIIVGFSAGGGYDTYSRLIARHMGRHIAGNPTIIVENMPGAGSLISANHVYNVAKPEGLTVGNFLGEFFTQQVLGRPGIEFDARKFEYIGVPVQDQHVIGISGATGITSIEGWLASKKELRLGAAAVGGTQHNIPRILKYTMGLPNHVVTGYKGSADIRLAFNNGEIHGLSLPWESFKATWVRELQSGELIIALQNVPKPHPDLPNVPLAISYAKTEEARKLIEAGIHGIGPTARPYVLPPGTPKERVRILRKAFMETLKDPEFLAEAKKAKLDINPLDGERLERNVKEIFNLEPQLVAKLKEILK